jgi:hypothetical protein
MLLPPSNSTSVSASELHISIYAHSETALDFASPGLEYILDIKFSNPGEPQSENACGFCDRRAPTARAQAALRRQAEADHVREMFVQMKDHA